MINNHKMMQKRSPRRCFQTMLMIFSTLVLIVVPDQVLADRLFFFNSTRQQQESCNFFHGSWVLDSSYPPYNTNTCPFIDQEFDCQKYGRPDTQYQKYAWKPDSSCTLPRFDGLDLLKRWKGKKIMIVGDSLSYNMWLSLACMIHASVPNAKISNKTGTISSITFQEYKVSLLFDREPFLVDVVREKVGRVLKLDSINNGKAWVGMDILIVNSWHWWTHTGKLQVWDYMEMGGKLYKDMDRLVAYSKGLATWANWVDLNVKPSLTKVFFQGISPTHYLGEEWNQPNRDCKGQKAPLPGSTYPAGLPPQTAIVQKVLKSMKTPVYLLNITTLSQLRIDAHPSLYSGGHPGNDCAHWCLPGLPDTWNQLLYAVLVS